MTNTPHKDCPVHGENLYWDISKPFECTCSPTPRSWEEKFRNDFDWVNCENFEPSPTDTTSRPCYKCGALTRFCLNCARDHHIEDRDSAIIARIRTIEDEAVRRTEEDIKCGILNYPAYIPKSILARLRSTYFPQR